MTTLQPTPSMSFSVIRNCFLDIVTRTTVKIIYSVGHVASLYLVHKIASKVSSFLNEEAEAKVTHNVEVSGSKIIDQVSELEG